MNILVFTNNTWDETNSIGNTINNFFAGKIWKDDNFYNIYNRNASPNNEVCNNYYKMTLVEMIKHGINKEKIGKSFIVNNNKKETIIENNKEQGFIDFMHKHSLNVVYPIANNIYRKKRWLNNNFKEYVNNSKPDIFFAFLIDVALLKPIVEYVKKNTEAKIVLFISDNVYYTYKSKLLKKEFEKIIDMADLLYGSSEELCEEYGKRFNTIIYPLYKGCEFEYNTKDKINHPIRFIYAGNMFYGRDFLLSKIAKAIDKSNKKGNPKALLEIYTNSTLTNEMKEKIIIDGVSTIKGKKKYNEIKKIMNSAEYNLIVESFEKKQIECVKYSFSTKIIDCLQSGSTIIGVGPLEVSSMKYISRIPGAHIINDLKCIDSEIEDLIIKSQNIVHNSKKIRDYAIKNHELINNQKKFRNDLIRIMNK